MKCDKCERWLDKEVLYTYVWHPTRKLQICEECFLGKEWVRVYDLKRVERFLDNFEVTWVGDTDNYEYAVFLVRQEAIYDAYEALLRKDAEIKSDTIEMFLRE